MFVAEHLMTEFLSLAHKTGTKWEKTGWSWRKGEYINVLLSSKQNNSSLKGHIIALFKQLFNKKSELISKCRHLNKIILKSVKKT